MTRRRDFNAYEAFMSKVHTEPMSGCWLWAGATKSNGYGDAQIPGGPRKTSAHRVSWMLHRGDPGALHVLHHCDNPACVNPVHLFLGTPRDNALDREAKGRGRAPSGWRNAKRRLTDEQYRRVRDLALLGWPQREIARAVGCGKSLVGWIIARTKVTK